MGNLISLNEFEERQKQQKVKGQQTPVPLISLADFNIRNNAQKKLKNSPEAKFYNYLTQPKQIETAQDKRNTWFNTGRKGNFIERSAGLAADVGLNVVKGIAGAGEKLGDLASYGVAGVADVLGAKDYAQSVREAAQANLVGNTLQPVTNQVNQYSILGDKLDSIVQSVGESYAMAQVGGALGKTKVAQKVGLGDALNKSVKLGKLNINIPLMSVLTGASSGITEAYQKGGNNQQAFIKGLTSGLAEGISEGIFGVFGQGGSSFEQEVMYKATKKIENQLARRLTKLGITAAGEGAEEGISYAFNYVADNLQDIVNEAFGKEINKMGDKWNWNEFGENILSGAIAGGLSGGAEMLMGNKGTGLLSGRKGAAILENTQHQVENKLNRPLNDAEIYTLAEETEKQLEKGKINVDALVERLQNPTVEDVVQQSKIKSDTNPQLDIRLQQNLQLPTQAFTTDTTNYTGTQLQTYQNAINSGLLNNNKNTHDFVDFVSRISKDKGIVFNFTNNQALQDRNINAQINGFIDNNGITLNVDSTMALEKVIGHEITHTLEDMVNEYNSLKNSFKQLLGEEYNTRLEQIKELYSGIEGANYENELISDLAGEYLFTNEEFINRLSTEKPSLFRRIYEEIKYLWKMATGTEQEKQLARAMRIYEQAYRNAGKVSNYNVDSFAQNTQNAQETQTTPQETKPITQYSLSENYTNNEKKMIDYFEEYKKSEDTPMMNKDVMWDSYNENTPFDEKEYYKTIEKYLKDYRNNDYHNGGTFNGQNFWSGSVSLIDGVIEEVHTYEDAHDADFNHSMYFSPTQVDKMDEGENAFFWVENGKINGVWRDEIPQNIINKIKEQIEIRKPNESKTQYSLSQDNQGRELTDYTLEKTKNSKVRDKNGNLMLMYHGSPNGTFEQLRAGTYFTSRKEYAQRFTNPGASSITSADSKKVNNPKVYEAYLNIENPFDISNPKIKDIYINEYVKGKYALGINPYLSNEEYQKIDSVDWTEAENLQEFLEENHPEFDGLILNEGADGGYGEETIFRGESYVPFKEEQIIKANENNTKYSLSTAEEIEKYNEDRKNVFKQLDKDFGGGTAIWEANLDGRDYEDSVRYLKQRESIKRKFAEENNIVVEDVMKPVEYRVAGNRNEDVQNYIRDNNITMEKLINDPNAQKQYFTELENAMLNDGWTQEEVDDYLTKFNDYFDSQRQRGNSEDIIWPLLRFQGDIENILENKNEVVDGVETAKRERQLIDDNPKFDKYVKKYVDKLFKTKPVLDAEEVMEEAKYNHGTTNNYETGAYMTTDGELLNFNDHGYRDDHRTISAFDLDMNEFMNYGAIRMKPESNGFEMAIEPTTEQYDRLYNYINDYAKNNPQNGDIVVDIDIPNTKSYDSAVYNLNTPTSKIINDIKTYYETGKFPQKSEYADFYYSLSQKQENLPKGQFKGKSVARDINVPTTQENALNVPLNRQKRVLNPTEISNLNPEDANTTPILPTTRTLTGDKQSRFLNNINQTEMLTQESKDLINNADIGQYRSVTNEESLRDASQKLSKGGKTETERWFRNDPKNVNATDIAEGFILLNQYQEIAKNSNNAADKYQANQSMVEVAKKLRQIGTEAGQTLQAYSILSRMTPEGMVYYAQSELQDAYNEMVKNKSRQWIEQNRENFELKPEETQFILDTMNEIANMEDGYEKKVKLAEIQKLMTDKLPPAKGQKIKSWMRLSMLFNPKTQVRNVAGNTLIVPVNSFSDIFASYADKLISRKTGKRTTGTTNIKAMLEGFKKGAYEATTDYKKGINTRDIEGNRFEIGEGKSFSDKSMIGKALNNTESLLNYVMDAGDRVFSEAAFENSLQNQLKLNNTNEITQDMIDIARQEALSRTWNDNNNYTKFVLNVRSMLNKINFGTYGLGDVLIPFAKTPANLTKAIVDYSPVGFVNTLLKGQKLSRSLENGQYTPQLQHDFVQTLGKATAGTMLYVLGMALAKAGITSGESDEDKDTQNFLKNTLGISNYSIKLGGKSFTYDWAQPIAAPLSITANIANRKDKEQALGEAILSNLDTASSVLLEQSFMQGINEVLNGNGGIVDGMVKQVLELPARAVPTLSKQIVDLTDSTQRTSYEYNKPVESAINAVKAKIPGLSQTLAPVVDTMGREVQRYGGKNNLFNVFLNPANVNTENISEAASEIYRVYKETGDKTIMPRVAPYYINKNEKITLNSKQKAEFQRISGEIINDNVKELIDNQVYENLNDTEKASIIKKIVDYSYNKARKDVLNIDMDNDYNKINKFVNDGGTPAEYYTNKEEIDYAYANPSKYQTIRQIAPYYTYKNYNTSIETLKNNYSTTNERKNAIINYVNGLELGIPQKAMLIRMNYSSFKQYDNLIIDYINSQDLTVEQKSDILKEIGFTIKNGVVYN